MFFGEVSRESFRIWVPNLEDVDDAENAAEVDWLVDESRWLVRRFESLSLDKHAGHDSFDSRTENGEKSHFFGTKIRQRSEDATSPWAPVRRNGMSAGFVDL